MMRRKAKRIAAVVLAAAMMMSLAACGSADTSDTGESADIAAADEYENPTSENDGEPVYGGKATLYFMNLSTDYDPASPDFENYQFWYERLFEPDWTNTETNSSYLDESDIKIEYKF